MDVCYWERGFLANADIAHRASKNLFLIAVRTIKSFRPFSHQYHHAAYSIAAKLWISCFKVTFKAIIEQNKSYSWYSCFCHMNQAQLFTGLMKHHSGIWLEWMFNNNTHHRKMLRQLSLLRKWFLKRFRNVQTHDKSLLILKNHLFNTGNDAQRKLAASFFDDRDTFAFQTMKNYNGPPCTIPCHVMVGTAAYYTFPTSK